MAIDAGITMSPSRLFQENDRRHFMTRRFDRRDNREKIHLQSLCASAHCNFNMAGAYSYEQALQVIINSVCPWVRSEKQFRRMAFNIVARNLDDHVKNIAFLMDKTGQCGIRPHVFLRPKISLGVGSKTAVEHPQVRNDHRGPVCHFPD